jgi:hypothetical protein
LVLAIAESLSALFGSHADNEVYKRCNFKDMQQFAASISRADLIIWRGIGLDIFTKMELTNTIREIKAQN